MVKRNICTCITETPKGIKYHPVLKVVYDRKGAKGVLSKVGYICPKCNKFYDMEGKEV